MCMYFPIILHLHYNCNNTEIFRVAFRVYLLGVHLPWSLVPLLGTDLSAMKLMYL